MAPTYARLSSNTGRKRNYSTISPFLDTLVKIIPITNKIDNNLPLDSNQPLDPKSNHPRHTIKNTIRQEFSRIYKLNTTTTDTFKYIVELTHNLRTHGYAKKEIDDEHTKALKYANGPIAKD